MKKKKRLSSSLLLIGFKTGIPLLLAMASFLIIWFNMRFELLLEFLLEPPPNSHILKRYNLEVRHFQKSSVAPFAETTCQSRSIPRLL
ncbi:hypothetical protein FRX31_024788 [Thalictrum thalictroides]|uniref:Uncharacterized protein n=1 Tax=Thalictrum thalictroides TaxID=46969 RepID=A0A7J6VL33_THATH|nr:hypothetical protein FRX31_024788 [Thalictrum thalictroides]